MTVNCQWIEKNLEALCCDTLTEEESRLARVHIENCLSCREDTRALNAIDPLIKNYFRRELEIAHRPRFVHKGRVLGLGGAAAAAVVVLSLLLVRNPQPDPVIAPVAATSPTAAPIPEVNTPAPIKQYQPEEVLRAKPSPEANVAADRGQRPVPAVRPDAPEFLVTDPAGYSHAINEYRGHVVVIGVWNRRQTESIANIERLYKAYADNPKLRFLGVAADRQGKPANTTFPVVYNEGSKLFGAQPGDFVVLNETGSVEMRGSLVRDFDVLLKTMQEK